MNAKKHHFKKIIPAIIALAIIFVALFIGKPSFSILTDTFNKFASNGSVSDYHFSVHYIDVGKADAILVKCDDKNILIDAGDVSTKSPVVAYLKREGVTKLDLVVATHPDRDHIGGMINVIYEFPIEKYLMPQVPEEIEPDNVTYEGLLSALHIRNVNTDIPKVPDDFILGEMRIKIFAPVKQYNNVNNNSIVMQIIYKDKKFLFTGDAETESENDILSKGYDLESDVLKVGHHGSKTSTSVKFLEAIKPKYAVICVGEDKNKLPKQEIIDRLNSAGARIYRTDINGTVILATNGDKIAAFTEK
jgi:beta-lactamase superfamily II metal-dependent hydrolase